MAKKRQFAALTLMKSVQSISIARFTP